VDGTINLLNNKHKKGPTSIKTQSIGRYYQLIDDWQQNGDVALMPSLRSSLCDLERSEQRRLLRSAVSLRERRVIMPSLYLTR